MEIVDFKLKKSIFLFLIRYIFFIIIIWIIHLGTIAIKWSFKREKIENKFQQREIDNHLIDGIKIDFDL